MAKIIGMCGRSGSGKGYVCRLFLQYGIPSVDTDAIYRRLTGPSPILSPCMLELMHTFGEEIVSEDGSLNRKKLAGIVFSSGDKTALEKLNQITHKYILNESVVMLRRMLNMGAPAVILDAPALFEARLHGLCDHVVCVLADEKTEIHRIMVRDQLTETEARNRLSSQITSEELKKRSEFSIDNSAGAPVEEQVKNLAAVFLK